MSARSTSGTADAAATLAYLDWSAINNTGYASVTDLPSPRLDFTKAWSLANIWYSEQTDLGRYDGMSDDPISNAVASRSFRANHSLEHRLLVLYQFLRDVVSPLIGDLAPDGIVPSAPRIVVSRRSILSRPRQVYERLLDHVTEDPNSAVLLSLSWSVLFAPRLPSPTGADPDSEPKIDTDPNAKPGTLSGLCEVTRRLCLPVTEVHRLISEGRFQGVLPPHGWEDNPSAKGPLLSPRIVPAVDTSVDPPQYVWQMEAPVE
ncbi:hypothetical protein HDU93_003507 [Gonapodya sp. JEL0774]|nr:hypothetical protein HDU93_003507 [Gonapodya sp. JEL0774]